MKPNRPESRPSARSVGRSAVGLPVKSSGRGAAKRASGAQTGAIEGIWDDLTKNLKHAQADYMTLMHAIDRLSAPSHKGRNVN